MRRTALAASRAGFDRVYVLGAEAGPSSRALEGTGARPFPRDAAESALPPGRIVLLPDRVVASPQWLRSLREAPAEPGRLHRLGAGAIVQTTEPASLARALARQSCLSAVVSEWSAALPPGPPAASLAPPLEVTTDSELAAAEALLLKSLVKKEDGIVTRYVSRKISLAVTRRLARTRVTPNVMTVVCVALGLAAAWAFASPALPRQIAGGLLFLLHSILDGCDGEMARLKFQESRLGGILDFWGDNLVHVGVFSAFALAWSSASGQSWPLVLGAVAVSGTVLSAGFIYNYAMRPRAGGGSLLTTASPIAPVADDTGPRRRVGPRLHLHRDGPLPLREGLLVPGGGVRGNTRVLRGSARLRVRQPRASEPAGPVTLRTAELRSAR